MAAVEPQLPQGSPPRVSQQATRLIALELFREATVSRSRARRLPLSSKSEDFEQDLQTFATLRAKVIADSSPLIVLAKAGKLDLLPLLYGSVTVTPEVFRESRKAGLAGFCKAVVYLLVALPGVVQSQSL